MATGIKVLDEKPFLVAVCTTRLLRDPRRAGRTLAPAGFLMWLAGVALLLLAFTAGRRFRAASRFAARLVEAVMAAVFYGRHGSPGRLPSSSGQLAGSLPLRLATSPPPPCAPAAGRDAATAPQLSTALTLARQPACTPVVALVLTLAGQLQTGFEERGCMQWQHELANYYTLDNNKHMIMEIINHVHYRTDGYRDELQINDD
uniref:Uncharacterized protein n=1 Tax=Setaria italica TaxID=4555 RepID=K3XZE9_SETIT